MFKHVFSAWFIRREKLEELDYFLLTHIKSHVYVVNGISLKTSIDTSIRVQDRISNGIKRRNIIFDFTETVPLQDLLQACPQSPTVGFFQKVANSKKVDYSKFAVAVDTDTNIQRQLGLPTSVLYNIDGVDYVCKLENLDKDETDSGCYYLVRHIELPNELAQLMRNRHPWPFDDVIQKRIDESDKIEIDE